MQGGDSKMQACEFQFESSASCLLPAKKFASQFVCELLDISVCTLSQVWKQ